MICNLFAHNLGHLENFSSYLFCFVSLSLQLVVGQDSLQAQNSSWQSQEHLELMTCDYQILYQILVQVFLRVQAVRTP